jgi:hypothetical protein
MDVEFNGKKMNRLNEIEQMILHSINMTVTISHLSEAERWEEVDAIVNEVEPLNYSLRNIQDLYKYYRLFLLLFRYPQDSSPEDYQDFVDYYFPEYSHLFYLGDIKPSEYRQDNNKIYWGGYYWRYVGEWLSKRNQEWLHEREEGLRDCY